MVEHRVLDGEETRPSVGNILGDGGTQPAKGGDVVEGADQERPHHYLRMDRRSVKVGAVPVFQGRHRLGGIQLLVDLNQKVNGVNEVP